MPGTNIHKSRLKSIRRFVSFDYDLRRPLTVYQRRKIKRYYDVVNALTARPTLLYRSGDANRLRAVQQFAQHDTTLTQLAVAFVPTANPHAKISITKSGVALSTPHVRTTLVPLDAVRLATDPQRHVAQSIKQHAPNAGRYTVQAGRYEIPVSLSADAAPRYVADLTNRYSGAGNHNFKNWLFGLNAHTFTLQSDFSAYDREKRAAKDALKNTRRKSRAKSKRQGLARSTIDTSGVVKRPKKAVKKKAVKKKAVKKKAVKKKAVKKKAVKNHIKNKTTKRKI